MDDEHIRTDFNGKGFDDGWGRTELINNSSTLRHIILLRYEAFGISRLKNLS